MLRTGILGGTFDPIHLGHLEAADAAKRSLHLDQILLVPSRTPPHRSVEPRASVYHRFAMTALAAAERGMLASDLELRREGPSFTALTLEALHRDGYAPSQLFFITGSDAFAEISTWYDYPRLFELSNFAVVSRPGYPAAVPRFPMTTSSTSVIAVEANTPDVSSTEIRRRVAAGESIQGLVAPSVASHIERHRLYVPAGVGAAR
ncbi:MAG TPA: nicotinate-nucleotide adenylyltransferase [Vicinamibacterales bacterium]|jgi:nicotinate-nucleotide adenylyltransferase|nr:nicotinate-nucleotide adenylyltransferase [Vicinamibacterales bacterium]